MSLPGGFITLPLLVVMRGTTAICASGGCSPGVASVFTGVLQVSRFAVSDTSCAGGKQRSSLLSGDSGNFCFMPFEPSMSVQVIDVFYFSGIDHRQPP